jgi:hypothetical protein
LAQHYLIKANITAIRRVRKSDNNRIARACGATIVNRTEEIKEEDIGVGAGLFEIRKIGEEYEPVFIFLSYACFSLPLASLKGITRSLNNAKTRKHVPSSCAVPVRMF